VSECDDEWMQWKLRWANNEQRNVKHQWLDTRPCTVTVHRLFSISWELFLIRCEVKGHGCRMCTDCKALWGKFIICDIGLYKITWIVFLLPQGLTPKVDSLASEEMSCLQQQNAVLRAVVTQMRKDMEGLNRLPPPPQASSPQPGQPPISPPATPQMATGPLDQSTNTSFKVSPAGVQSALLY